MTTTPQEPVEPPAADLSRLSGEEWAQHQPEAPETESPDPDDSDDLPAVGNGAAPQAGESDGRS